MYYLHLFGTGIFHPAVWVPRVRRLGTRCLVGHCNLLCCWTSTGAFNTGEVLFSFPVADKAVCLLLLVCWWFQEFQWQRWSRRLAIHISTVSFGIGPMTGSWRLSSCDHSFRFFRAAGLQEKDKRIHKASERLGSLQRHLCGIELVKANCLGNPEANRRERGGTGRGKVKLWREQEVVINGVRLLCPSTAPVFTWSPAGGTICGRRGNFRRQNLAGGRVSLEVALGILDRKQPVLPPGSHCLFIQ